MSAPTLLLPREEWPDADFDLPEGAPLQPPSEREEEDEDWDMEMDLGEAGGAKAMVLTASLSARSELSTSVAQLPGINIRPPLRLPNPDDEDENDEGISTIKASAFPTIHAKTAAKPVVESIDEDFEDGFALPTDLTQLSLAPQSLSHRSSKNSLEWGDKDNSSSSQSSDAYSTLGFADASPSSHSTSSPSLPDTETEEDEDDLEGLILPSSMFESGQSARQLKKILELKKAQPTTETVSVSKGDPEEDFELGLVINDDVDLSPSRLVSNAQHKSQRPFSRSHSIPPQRPSTLRPPSRAKLDRSKSPLYPPVSSAKQLQKIRASPSPPLRPPSRSQQTFSALVSKLPIPAPPPSPSNLLSPKPGSLRGQKSHSGLKPPSPPGSTRKLTRKASLSSLIESSQTQASGSGTILPEQIKPRYDEPTAASRAKSAHKNSTSRLHDFKVPPTRPSTPSSNPAALRLTMPTQSRLRSRPALSQVFGGPSKPGVEPSLTRSSSPLPPRPPSNNSLRSSAPSRTATISPPMVAPRLLRRPKRPKIYGDGTELDGFEDLPTDRDKEVRYRVQPKGFGNRIPGATYHKTSEKEKSSDKGTVRRRSKRDGPSAIESAAGTLRRTTTRVEFPSITSSTEVLPKKKRNISSPPSSTTKRKPTLIRNLGGSNAPKVVGDMKWNPQTLRWEGNDQVLRDFDVAVGTSTRPALITQLTGSGPGSPAGSFASGARIVGNMIFDPTKMCWISTLPPEDDEPDVFANLADDEEDSDAWESKGGTIRALVPNNDVVKSRRPSDSNCDTSNSSHSRTLSESGSERGSRASMVVCDMDDAFIQSCRDAEDRHRIEMKGWKSSLRDTSLASDHTTAVVYLLTYGGGLVSGDEVDLKVTIDLAATLVLLSQGTTKVFKARPGRRLASVKPITPFGLTAVSENLRILTRQSFHFRIAAKGLLLLLPEPVTCFRDASYSQYQRFHIQDDGSAVILDWITSGRISMGEDWAFSHYYSVNEISHNERRIAKDVMLLDDKDLNPKIPGRALKDRLQPYSCYATLILYGPQVQSIIAEISSKYDQISVFKSKTPASLIWSLSPIDSTKQGVVIRVGGRETEMVKEWLKDALSGLEQIVGLDIYRRAFP